MNIVATTRTIVEYPCTFSLEDLQLADTDPYLFGEKFRELIHPLLHPAAEANGNGHAKPHRPGWDHPGKGKRAAKKQGRKKAATPKAPKAPARKLTNECPYCDELYSRAGNLARHIEKVHPEHAGKSASATETTWQKEPAPAAE